MQLGTLKQACGMGAEPESMSFSPTYRAWLQPYRRRAFPLPMYGPGLRCMKQKLLEGDKEMQTCFKSLPVMLLPCTLVLYRQEMQESQLYWRNRPILPRAGMNIVGRAARKAAEQFIPALTAQDISIENKLVPEQKAYLTDSGLLFHSFPGRKFAL